MMRSTMAVTPGDPRADSAGVRVAACGRSPVLVRRGATVSRVPPAAAGGAQPALGVEQEHARGDDPLAFCETRANLDAIGELHAERDRSRLEAIADARRRRAAAVPVSTTASRGTVMTSGPPTSNAAVP